MSSSRSSSLSESSWMSSMSTASTSSMLSNSMSNAIDESSFPAVFVQWRDGQTGSLLARWRSTLKGAAPRVALSLNSNSSRGNSRPNTSACAPPGNGATPITNARQPTRSNTRLPLVEMKRRGVAARARWVYASCERRACTVDALERKLGENRPCTCVWARSNDPRPRRYSFTSSTQTAAAKKSAKIRNWMRNGNSDRVSDAFLPSATSKSISGTWRPTKNTRKGGARAETAADAMFRCRQCAFFADACRRADEEKYLLVKKCVRLSPSDEALGNTGEIDSNRGTLTHLAGTRERGAGGQGGTRRSPRRQREKQNSAGLGISCFSSSNPPVALVATPRVGGSSLTWCGRRPNSPHVLDVHFVCRACRGGSGETRARRG